MKVWENSKKLWKHSPEARVPTAFLVLPHFHSCFYKSIEYGTCFYFLTIKVVMFLVDCQLSLDVFGFYTTRANLQAYFKSTSVIKLARKTTIVFKIGRGVLLLVFKNSCRLIPRLDWLSWVTEVEMVEFSGILLYLLVVTRTTIKIVALSSNSLHFMFRLTKQKEEILAGVGIVQLLKMSNKKWPLLKEVFVLNLILS